ncbi:hypothetical protein CRE_19509 [Caenorhabditis remanei]|uniref:F-box domain-containing protein n=1 Tax=Caenorhabditis remanei TaxID=31234 RepID=E3NHZ8_CAERE|nr:hypothetical protein CRE_19509 [Caenorhabditis remanei]
MNPLMQLPILRLPFRAMEEVSKGMRSIIKMISNRRNNKFPILRLPFLAIEEIFKTMHPNEIINFSMISKRAKAVAKLMSFYSKYSIHLSVDKLMLDIELHGTKNVVSYIMKPSDEAKDGKIWEKEKNGYIKREVYNYSKDPIEEWKQLCKFVLEIFKKQTIDVFSINMGSFVDQNDSIIDFLKTNVQSVNDCKIYQLDEEINVENFAYFLNNITIDNELASWLHIENYYFDGKIPKNLNELYIHNSRWVGYERLLEIDSKRVVLTSNQITNEEWNLFLKKWIAKETHLNLEYLQFNYREIEEFRALVLHDIPHEVVDEAVKRVLKIYRDEKREVNGGIDIRRTDGKTATFFAHHAYEMQFLAMSVQ